MNKYSVIWYVCISKIYTIINISMKRDERGFTLIEMVVALGVFSIIALSILGFYTTLISSTIIMKQKSIAITIANNQLEYLRSLPYANLAVSGGSIYSPTPIPSTKNESYNSFKYTVKTSINYVDDAYDGCGAYPNATIKQQTCRNYPAPAGTAEPDTNPQDYKVAHVEVYNKNNTKLVEIDTYIASKVAETASTTGALFVTVIDDNGNPVAGANVRAQNNSLTPQLNLNDSTDSNGTAVFYGLPPDSSYNYILTASKSGYSTLNSIARAGVLQATYPNQQILTQQSSYATMVIKPQGANSLLIETTDTAGAPLSSVRTYIKGGYKKYTATTDTAYYYDSISPSDIRPTTDASGLAAVSDLVPGSYIFCGDLGATSCTRSGSTVYLVAAVPYAGSNSLGPIAVPTQATSGDPGTSYILGSSSYLQKVRLMFSTSSSHPRVFSMSPYQINTTDNLANVTITIKGANLPCSSNAASCSTVVTLQKDAVTYAGSCTGSNTGQQVNCRFDLRGVTVGALQMRVTANGQTLTLPTSPQLGGVKVE
jgi:prepilin-type N-terminal cleavage/methylation domain-containing protein